MRIDDHFAGSSRTAATGAVRPKVAYMLGVFPALTETFVLREIGAIRRRGLEIVVCAIRRPRDAEDLPRATVADFKCEYARPDGVVRHALANLACLLRRPRRYVAGLRTFLRAAVSVPPREARQLLYHFFAGVGFGYYLRRRGVTHFHCHFTSATNMALAAHIVADAPFSFTAHASDDLFVRPLLLDEKVARARFVVAVCDYSRRFLDSITGFRFSPKLHRIYNGVEQRERWVDGTTERSFSHSTVAAERPRIVSVGSLVAAKGHATLIHVCAGLQARGQRFHCRIVGEGPERPTLERLIVDHDVEKCVELVGAMSLDGVYAELRQADLFVLLAEIGPSGYRDGFPTVILEAMAAGLPVLATSLSGIPEMVLDGVTGMLVRERDVEGASRALECLLESAELRRAMGLAGRARVRDLFDLDRSAGELAVLLNQRWPPASTGSTG
jgi:glycosyltransferase involved in cell wall biosynthesis